MPLVKRLAGLVALALGVTLLGPSAATAADPKPAKVTVEVRGKNRFEVIYAAARGKAFAVCTARPEVGRVKVTAVRKGVGFRYSFRCAEVLEDPVGPTLP